MLCFVDMDRGFVNTIHTRSLDGPRLTVAIRSHPLEVSVLPSALACHNAVNGMGRVIPSWRTIYPRQIDR
jgi:hypothetical protein